MPNFFEKSVTKKITRLVAAGLPGVRVEMIPSDYAHDALTIRVHVTPEVFTDTSVFGTNWVIVARARGARAELSPQNAIRVYDIGGGGLSIEQVAGGVLQYHRQAWVPLQRFVEALSEIAEEAEGSDLGEPIAADELNPKVDAVNAQLRKKDKVWKFGAFESGRAMLRLDLDDPQTMPGLDYGIIYAHGGHWYLELYENDKSITLENVAPFSAEPWEVVDGVVAALASRVLSRRYEAMIHGFEDFCLMRAKTIVVAWKSSGDAARVAARTAALLGENEWLDYEAASWWRLAASKYASARDAGSADRATAHADQQHQRYMERTREVRETQDKVFRSYGIESPRGE